jgi:hypothetical protein
MAMSSRRFSEDFGGSERGVPQRMNDIQLQRDVPLEPSVTRTYGFKHLPMTFTPAEHFQCQVCCG